MIFFKKLCSGKNNNFRVLIALFTVFINPLIAQNSPYLIASFSEKETNASKDNYLVDQTIGGEMVFANVYGLLEFNGSKWNSYYFRDSLGRHITFTQVLAHRDIIYVGGNNNFGYLTKSNNKYHFTSLKMGKYKNEVFHNVTQIVQYQERIFFASRTKIFVTDGKKILNIITTKGNQLFAYLFNLNNKKLILNQSHTGLLEWSGDKFIKNDDRDIFKKDHVNLIHSGSDGQLIVFHSQGIWLKSLDGHLQKMSFGKKIDSLIKTQRIYCSSIYGTDSVILGTANGSVYKLHIKNNSIERVYFGNSYIRDVFVDKAHNLWVINNEKVSHIEISSQFNISLPKLDVRDIIATNAGVFAATLSKNKSLFQVKGQIIEVDTLSQQGESWALCNIGQGNLLIGTIKGVFLVNYLNRSSKKLLNLGGVYSINTDRFKKNIIYISTINSLYTFEYKDKKLIKHNKIKDSSGGVISLLRTKKHLWQGSIRAGIIKYTFAKNNFPQVIKKTYYGTSNGHFSGDDNACKIREVNGEVWINNSSGIYRYNEKVDSFSKINLGVLNTPNKALYTSRLATNGDTLFICGQNNKFSHFGMIHQKNEELYSWYDTPFRRLPSYEIRKLLVHNNKLYIATSKGLLRYDPNKKKNYHIQYPTLIKVSNMNTTYLPPRVRLPYQQNQVTFEYSAPFYEAPDKTLFSYRLMGFDKEWSDWGKDTKKEYTNLPEGNYTFQVKAKNVYGTESTVASYTFTILPPWYRTWWAYILYGLAGFALFIGGSYTYNHYRSKQLYRRNQLLEQEVTERTEEILAQKEEITQQADMLKTANEGLKQANEKLHQVNQIIKKESDDKVGIYAQEVTDAMIRLEQVREVFESSGAETAKRMLNVELNTTGKLTVIRQKVSDAFPEFVVKLDKALANKQINKTIWQVAHCLKLGMKPKEIAEILPVQARSVSTFGSKLRKLGLLTKEG